MGLSEIMENRKINKELQAQEREHVLQYCRTLAPARCHDFKCPYACWLRDEVHCRSRRLPGGPVRVKSFSSCPEHCWGIELDTERLLGHLEEAIAETERTLWESSRKALEIESEIGSSLIERDNLEAAAVKMSGKFDAILDDYRAKEGDPSSELDKSIWLSGTEKIRTQFDPQINKNLSELEIQRSRQRNALGVLKWLKGQRNSTQVLMGKIFYMTKLLPNLPKSLQDDLIKNLPTKEIANNEERNNDQPGSRKRSRTRLDAQIFAGNRSGKDQGGSSPRGVQHKKRH
jgi:hypothetical protein